MRRLKTKSKTHTRKRKQPTANMNVFQQEITTLFLEMLLMIKLFHWKTTNFAVHKATDELYTKLNANVDSFIEVLLGKSGSRIDLTQHKHIRLMDVTSLQSLQREINNFKIKLIKLNNQLQLKQSFDLFNIRDSILADLNQFLYLLTFH